MALHQLLDQYSSQLQDHIGDTYLSLQEMIATSSDTIALQQRLDVLECVGVIDDEFGIVDDIKSTQQQLRTKIRVVVADTHSEIEALESKIDQSLLDQFEENLEIAVVQNKVESLLTEYINVVDTYFDLAIDEIDQLENDISNNNDAYQAVINNYDDRKQLLQELEEEFLEFNKKSSFV
jgi:Fe2+ transport system protein B